MCHTLIFTCFLLPPFLTNDEECKVWCWPSPRTLISMSPIISGLQFVRAGLGRNTDLELWLTWYHTGQSSKCKITPIWLIINLAVGIPLDNDWQLHAKSDQIETSIQTWTILSCIELAKLHKLNQFNWRLPRHLRSCQDPEWIRSY